MFAMYDDDGLKFRSTIDHLYNLHEITPSDGIKSATEREQQGSFKDNLYHGNKITQEAKEKYKQITNLDTRAEIYHVEQVMTRNVITVNDTKTIKECYDIMIDNNIGQLPIIADSELHLKGIISFNDLLKYIMEDIDYAKHNIHKHIYEISAKNILTTDPISDIRRVSKVMTDFNLNAIPVVNNSDILVGIVSRTNILKAVSSIPHLQIWA